MDKPTTNWCKISQPSTGPGHDSTLPWVSNASSLYMTLSMSTIHNLGIHSHDSVIINSEILALNPSLAVGSW